MTIEELWAASDGEEIDSRQLAAFLSAGGEGIRLVDCREEEEFSICRLPRAELMPLSEFGDHVARLNDTNVPIVVYCHHGMRSLQAARFLKHKGFGRSLSLHGGIDAWSLLIDPAVPRYT